jgi:hypothetical protein
MSIFRRLRQPIPPVLRLPLEVFYRYLPTTQENALSNTTVQGL